MNINGLIIIWLIPSLLYYFINKNRGMDKKTALGNLGLRWCKLKFILFGIIIGILSVVLTVYVIRLNIFPEYVSEFIDSNNYDLPITVKSFVLIFLLVGITTGLGEEVFFRGFLGGILIRKTNFHIGNGIQALVFAIFHFIPVAFFNPNLIIFSLIYSFIFGYIFGILYYKSGSIIPSALAHSLGFPVLFLLMNS